MTRLPGGKNRCGRRRRCSPRDKAPSHRCRPRPYLTMNVHPMTPEFQEKLERFMRRTTSWRIWHNCQMVAERVPGLPIDVIGPVRAEVFVVAHDGTQIVLTGPDGPQAWHIESANDEHPLDLVRTMATSTMDDVSLVHSTSWRWDRQAVVLTFIVVVSPAIAAAMRSVPIVRSDLARSAADRAPDAIDASQVLEHALRHLAWLAKEDPVVGGTLSDAWLNELATYIPSPFRQLEKEQ